MAKTARRLGRGLDSLVTDLRGSATAALPETATNREESLPSRSTEPGSNRAASMLPVSVLQPNPFQPRQEFREEDIQSLATSIRRNGLLQPIVVRKHQGSYQIIAGERRWRAAKVCGIIDVPIVIRTASDEQMVELALIENIQREDLNPIDRARAYRSFCDRFHLTAEEVAERVGEDRSTVANYMRLLELPKAIRDLVAAGQLSMGHARCLLGIADEARQLQLAESSARHDLSVRALEDIVRRAKSKSGGETDSKALSGRARTPHLRELQTRFEQVLQTKVTIREGKKKGSGRIVIQYYSLDDFDRVADRLGISLE